MRSRPPAPSSSALAIPRRSPPAQKWPPAPVSTRAAMSRIDADLCDRLGQALTHRGGERVARRDAVEGHDRGDFRGARIAHSVRSWAASESSQFRCAWGSAACEHFALVDPRKRGFGGAAEPAQLLRAAESSQRLHCARIEAPRFGAASPFALMRSPCAGAALPAARARESCRCRLRQAVHEFDDGGALRRPCARAPNRPSAARSPRRAAGLDTHRALTVSPRLPSGTAITQASCTAGCSYIVASTSPATPCSWKR